MSDKVPTIADWGELKFLDWVRRIAGPPKTRSPLTVPIGDDAAVFNLAKTKNLIVTTDALIEDVHFRRDWISPRDLGAKSLAVNLSDIAAMGGAPISAFLSIGVPPETRIDDLKKFTLGFRDLGAQYDCPLAGGDLVRAPQWVINVMALGKVPPGGRAILRSAARPGQTLYVTGRPGESGAGYEALRRGDREPALIARHNRPAPRIAEALALARTCRDLAMLDVSDGIWNDAGQLARASSVAIEIEMSKLPISRAIRRYAEKIKTARPPDPIDWVLDGGEDYELLFSTRTKIDRLRSAFAAAKIKTEIHAIGRVAEGAARVHLMDESGKRLHRAPRTFQHFA